MTFVELVNDVLIRLRETTVQSVVETPYSTLIGRYVNDAKRQVEDAFGWNVLNKTVIITTNVNDFSYPMTGAGQKFSVHDVLNTTSLISINNISTIEMNRYQNLIQSSQPVKGIPTMYAFNGSNGTDTLVTLFPRPDNVYNIPFLLTVPQPNLTADSTLVLVPDFLVVQNAYARALNERGEDGGMTSSGAYQLFSQMLADSIALEGTRFPEDQQFSAI